MKIEIQTDDMSGILLDIREGFVRSAMQDILNQVDFPHPEDLKQQRELKQAAIVMLDYFAPYSENHDG